MPCGVGQNLNLKPKGCLQFFFQNPSKLRCCVKCKFKKNAVIFKSHKLFFFIHLRRLLLLVKTQDITSSFPTRTLSLVGHLINVKDLREPTMPVSEQLDILQRFGLFSEDDSDPTGLKTTIWCPLSYSSLSTQGLGLELLSEKVMIALYSSLQTLLSDLYVLKQEEKWGNSLKSVGEISCKSTFLQLWC